MVAIVTFARSNNKRFPGKNSHDLCGKMLIEYTLEIMQKLKEEIYYVDCFCFSDNKEILSVCEKYNVFSCEEPSEMLKISDVRLNVWADMLLKREYYVLLQPTNPIRDFKNIKKWIEYCIINNVNSAYSAIKKDNDLIENGNFYFYTPKFMYANKHVKNGSSIIFEDKYYFDIDYKRDLKNCENFLNKNKK